MQIYQVFSTLTSNDGVPREIGYAVEAEGQALIMALSTRPETLTVDYEYNSIQVAQQAIYPQVLAFEESKDAVRSYTELFALAAEKYGWDLEAQRYWLEREPVSVNGKERQAKRVKKPKGFTRVTDTQAG